MSVKVASAEATKLWNSKTFFPSKTYAIRCLTEEVRKSESSGNPMVELEWEIVDEPPAKIGDQMVEFDGVKFTTYSVLTVLPKEDVSEEEAAKKSANAFKFYQDKFLRFVHPNVVTEGWDDENPPPMKGAVLWVALYGTKKPTYNSPTPEQLAKGQKVGSIMKDPITQKDVITYQINIGDVFGLYPNTPQRPF